MATTTTNFGWDIPQSTDLVKDGATAIAALGQDIDTALVDLKGGTTGQVLAKASNTDLDFTWATDASGIPATIFDAKGDIIAATAADTASRLAVGTNGQVLTADSTTATGLKWATAGGGGKLLQLVQATYSTQQSVTTTTYSDTGLSLSITPTLSTSKILVMINQQYLMDKNSNNATMAMQIVRGSTSVFDTGSNNTAAYIAVGGSTANSLGGYVALCYLDSPATTSSTTYKTQVKVNVTQTAAYLQYGSGLSTITLMEIGA